MTATDFYMRVNPTGWEYRYTGGDWSPMQDHSVEMRIDSSVSSVQLSITNNTGADITALWIEGGPMHLHHDFAPPNLPQRGTVTWPWPTPMDEMPDGMSIEWTIAGRVPAPISGNLPDPTFKITRMGGGR